MRGLVQAWLLFVVAASLQPARPSPVRVFHGEVHWFAFGITALLMLSLSRNWRQEMCATAATCLLGLTLELSQHLIYRSPMEWRDVADDLLAAFVAFALYRCIRFSMFMRRPARHS